jgi:hypothetical protein
MTRNLLIATTALLVITLGQLWAHNPDPNDPLEAASPSSRSPTSTKR